MWITSSSKTFKICFCQILMPSISLKTRRNRSAVTTSVVLCIPTGLWDSLFCFAVKEYPTYRALEEHLMASSARLLQKRDVRTSSVSQEPTLYFLCVLIFSSNCA